MFNDNDDEFRFEGLYEGGHWVWDEETQALLFVRDKLPRLKKKIIKNKTEAPSSATIQFDDHINLIEQIRYRRRYQRKIRSGQADLVTLQDIKDLAIYTAPIAILCPMLIRMLHTPTVERFIRALILYCAYYLQIADTMTQRVSELSSKVRTPNCDRIENEFQDDLNDLRLLVAKEYCIILVGAADMKKFHHMGHEKKQPSLLEVDQKLFESLVRVSIQIVWIALGRKHFNQIEKEVHRILKSDVFNFVEHSIKTENKFPMKRVEEVALFGHCVHRDRKLKTQSPLMNELFCDRPIDYRLLGLGVINYPQLSTRLKFLHLLVAGREEDLMASGLTLGIIGLPRSKFDTMLRLLPPPAETKSRNSMASMTFHSSRSSMRKDHFQLPLIVIPRKDGVSYSTPFPDETVPGNPINRVQLKRWLRRTNKLLNLKINKLSLTSFASYKSLQSVISCKIMK